jgi:hypothetical protein
MVADPIQKNTTTFHDALEHAELLARQALPEVLHERLSCAVALVKDGKVMQLNDGHTWEVESASVAGKIYSINGAGCSCEDAHYRAPQGRCKHMLATLLCRKTLALIHQAQAPPATEVPPPAPEPEHQEPAVGIDPRWLTTIQGRPFIRFEGLLSLAHERGLVQLTTRVVTVTETLAVCESTARFKDGLVVTDIGDATPSNVKAHLKPHFVRMAATRASARALRRALNIDAVSVEELGDDA